MVQFIDNKKSRLLSVADISHQFNSVNNQIDRLMILEYVWNKVVGKNTAFWVLTAVKQHTLYVKVKAAVAKNALVGYRRTLIKELNKNFSTPWIKHIEIQ